MGMRNSIIALQVETYWVEDIARIRKEVVNILSSQFSDCDYHRPIWRVLSLQAYL